MEQAPQKTHDTEATVSTYFAVFGTLAVLTVVTVAVSAVDFGHIGNDVLALTVALTKAALVLLFFMHLKGEAKVVTAIALLPLLLVGVLFALNAQDALVLAAR